MQVSWRAECLASLLAAGLGSWWKKRGRGKGKEGEGGAEIGLWQN